MDDEEVIDQIISKGSNTDIYALDLVDDIYEFPDMVTYAHMDFYYEYNSLYRYWVLIKKHLKDHATIAEERRKIAEGSSAGEDIIFFEEIEGVDVEKFPDFLLGSIITIALSMLETFLEAFSKEIAHDRGIALNIEKNDRRSFIDKYLFWLSAKCGLNIDYDPNLYQSINTIREIRNNFIHRLDKDLPEKAKKIIAEMVHGSVPENNKIDEEFVEASLLKISQFVKKAEEAYVKDWEMRRGSEQTQ